MAAGSGKVMVLGQCGPQFSNGEMLARAGLPDSRDALGDVACVSGPPLTVHSVGDSAPAREGGLHGPSCPNGPGNNFQGPSHRKFEKASVFISNLCMKPPFPKQNCTVDGIIFLLNY